MPDLKYCPDCKTTKPVKEFHRLAKSKDGRHFYCKQRGQYHHVSELDMEEVL